MKSIKRKLLVALVIVLSLITFAEYSWASTLLPWVRFGGTYQVTAGIGTGSLTLNATIKEMDYENGDVWRANVPGIETVYGARVVLSGAIRTGNYSFNGDPANPDDVILSIVASDGYVYFTSTLADSVFTQQGAYYVWLNQWLNANDPATLNLYNVILRPNGDDGLHPSRYIDELLAYLGSSNVSGMQMKLYVPPTQNFTTNSSGTIISGLIDGLQSLNSPPVVNAGNDITVTTEQVAATTIQGNAVDPDGDLIYCRWTEGLNVLQDWTLVGTNGECPLDLSALSLGLGVHTLTLEVNDGQTASSDDMILTINNSAPHANAGENVTITSEQVVATTIQGTASDFDGDALQCRWMEGLNELQGWTPAGTNGECPLNLSGLPLGLGAHTLILEVNDGQTSTSDDMILTVDNSAPHAAPGGAGVYEINSTVILPGDVSDYDGDLLYYEWLEGTNVFCSGNIQSVALGDPVMLPDCLVSGLSLGTHTISLQVSDGINLPDRKDVTVKIIDTTAPTLSPVASAYILWPPNHIMVDIVIAANAVDNSGYPVTLTASVASNEPIEGLGDGDTGPDWTQPVIDQNTGMIYLQLRRERSGRGTGRVYTITITATDSSNNTSTTTVNITVPHDMGKKK